MSDSDIVTFIRARLADDQEAAEAAHREKPARWRCDYSDVYDANGAELIGSVHYGGAVVPPYVADHIARQDPARTLRRVAAYRAILSAVEKWRDPHPGQPCTNEDVPWDSCELHVAATGRVSEDVLPLLATEWSDHPDYDQSWSVTA